MEHEERTEPADGFFLPQIQHPVRTIGSQKIDFSRSVAVMAIVNRTPDSFYDHGRTFGIDAAIDAGLAAVEAGADWIDVGGVPFAPGPQIDAETEIERVVPVVRSLSGAGAVVSVDTASAEVAAASIDAGAAVINDTSGLRDLRMADVVAGSEASLVIVHSLAGPRQEHPAPVYDDVVREVAGFLSDRIEAAVARGVPAERLIADPGHDLNKNTLHSLELTRRLSEIAALGLPTLAAVSNKDFVGETLAADRGHRVEGSLAAAVACILQGARIVRMHDVPQAVAAVRMTEAILGWREPAYLRHNMEAPDA